MNSHRFAWRPSACFIFAVAAILDSTPALAQREAKIYAVTKWDGGCAGSTRNSWDNMADAWYDEITNTGVSVLGTCIFGHCNEAYARDGRRVNGSVINSKFADANVVSWGNDSPYLDDADAALVAWHGSESGNDYEGSMRVNEAGGGNCTLLRSEMAIGNTDLEFLHLSSCNSMDDNQWPHWWKAFAGAHQVDGFHGFMWIGQGRVSDYRDFADDAFHESLADAWLDNLYVEDVSGSDDQCPVAYAVGADRDDVARRMATERYNNVKSRPTIGHWMAIYFSGCNPQNAGRL